MARTWLPVELQLVTHRKTRALARLWRCHPYTVVGFLVALWGYCLEFQSDGRLSDVPDEDLDELAAPCLASVIGTHPSVREALLQTGFLDPDGALHDWQEYAGRLVTKREKDAERKRQKRAASAGHPADRPRTSAPTAQHSTAQREPPPPRDPAVVELEGLVPGTYREALTGALRGARNPAAVVASLRALGPGGIHHQVGVTWEHVGRALQDWASSGEPFRVRTIEIFVGDLRRRAERPVMSRPQTSAPTRKPNPFRPAAGTEVPAA